ncbi:hypothetical protein QBC43DRAFT_294933 [Cladorrhinum sp. PSN259]|nr:hypothetical protein QBC43DRAFT_294933 [Cladorrhinum sp. PSN259]
MENDLLKRIDSEPNIYECDLVSFFDSVNLKGLSNVLTSNLMIPPSEAKFIFNLNQSIVEFAKGGDMQKEKDRDVLYHANLEEHANRERFDEAFGTLYGHFSRYDKILESMFEARANTIEEIRSLEIASKTVPGFLKVAKKRRDTLDYLENEIMVIYFDRAERIREEVVALEIASKTVPGFVKLLEKKKAMLDYFEEQRQTLELKAPLAG